MWGKGSQYDTGERDIVSNMGYHGTTAQTFTLQLEGRGEYRFSDLKVIVQPMYSYGENYVKLQECRSTDTQINGNYVQGTVVTGTDRMLCIAIPYQKGWKAWVNGKETKIKRYNNFEFGSIRYSSDISKEEEKRCEIDVQCYGKRYNIECRMI